MKKLLKGGFLLPLLFTAIPLLAALFFLLVSLAEGFGLLPARSPAAAVAVFCVFATLFVTPVTFIVSFVLARRHLRQTPAYESRFYRFAPIVATVVLQGAMALWTVLRFITQLSARP